MDQQGYDGVEKGGRGTVMRGGREHSPRGQVLCAVFSPSVVSDSAMDCSPPGSSVHGDSPGKNPGVDCHALPQGIFLNQGSNPGLSHCRQIVYHLSHQGSPQGSWFHTIGPLSWGVRILSAGRFVLGSLWFQKHDLFRGRAGTRPWASGILL